jgi:tRNA threonylcarbamoyl adenosine modification protein YeaZ
MPPDALALAIDSASPAAGVAVLRGDEVVAERQWDLETTFSLELLAAIDSVLASASVTKDELTAIAVSVGPGGYSGLRTGVATAQGLALALDLPLAGVSRLEAQAYPQLDGDRPVIAVHDPGRDQIAWAAYAQGHPPPELLVDARIDDPEACVGRAPQGALWCGEVTDELRAALDATGRGAEAVPPPDNTRRACDLVRLARLHDAYGDPADVDVVYLRPPNITKPRPRSKQTR